MTETEALSAPLEDLRAAYREAARNHGTALTKGRHRVANRLFDELILIGRELLNRGKDGQRVFEQLFGDEDSSTRVWAATHALSFAGAAAEKVLERAAAEPASPVRLSAELTLAEWRAGRLSIG